MLGSKLAPWLHELLHGLSSQRKGSVAKKTHANHRHDDLRIIIISFMIIIIIIMFMFIITIIISLAAIVEQEVSIVVARAEG